MPTASEGASTEAGRWRGIAARWSPQQVPDVYADVPPSEHAVVAFFDPNEDLERRITDWGFAMQRPHLDELARFAASLAEAEREAWEGDIPDLAVRTYETRRLLVGDRIAHWGVPWLDAVGRSYQELRSAAVDDRDTILAIADEMRIAPVLSGSEGLVVPGEDAFGPIVADVPLHVLLRSVWSGDVLLRTSNEPAGAEQYEAAAERWRSLAEDHPGSARLWLDLANRAEHTARSLR